MIGKEGAYDYLEMREEKQTNRLVIKAHTCGGCGGGCGGGRYLYGGRTEDENDVAIGMEKEEVDRVLLGKC